MQTRFKDPEIENFLNHIKINSDLLLNEINDILDYSQISKGKLRLNASNFSFQELIEETLMLFRLTASEKKIEILYVNSESDFELISDKIRLKQVLINLIGNSLKFTFQGFIKIKVSRTNQNAIEISISDTGIGMTGETLHR